MKDTNVKGDTHNNKILIDSLLLSPLIITPILGLTMGLLLIKHRRYKFTPKFWLTFTLLNGLIMASVANWPLRAPLSRLLLEGQSSPVINMIFWNFIFWVAILIGGILIIDRLILPIISHRSEE